MLAAGLNWLLQNIQVLYIAKEQLNVTEKVYYMY